MKGNKIRQAFTQHGVPLELAGTNQFIGDSPFHEKGRRKLYVNQDTGAWDCKVTGKSGGFKKFLQEKSEVNRALLTGVPGLKISRDRGLKMQTLRAWRVGWDGGQYTIPVDAVGKFYDLRRYSIGQRVRGTSGCNVSLAGITSKTSDEVWLTEGEWDGMAMTEITREVDYGTSVYSVPGANILPQHTLALFSGKRVRVAYDNDEAGRMGCLRVAKNLLGVAKELKFVHWPEDLPDGFDVRDLYHTKETPQETWKLLNEMLKTECPGGDVDAGQGPSGKDEQDQLTGKGLAPAEVLKRFRKYLYLPNAEVLSIMFGTVMANRLDGDPLWLFFVAPPGGTKTELLISMAEAPLIRTISSLTPRTLVSGASNAGAGDPSLLPQLDARVLIIKDFTTILSMPIAHREEIFGTLREVYDGRFEKGWGTGLFRTYKAKFGIIAGVTPVIEKVSSSGSVLGERFIKYRIPRPTRIASDDVLIDAALANLNKETEMRSKLRDTATEVLNRRVTTDDIPDLGPEMRVRIRKLAQWVARLRGVVSREKYTGNVEYKPTAEIGTRLAKQFAKLAQGVAIYHFEHEITEQVYQIVLSVALSTIPDRVEEVVKQMYLHIKDEEPVFATTISDWCRFETNTVRMVLQDLELLRIIQQGTIGGKISYRLSAAVRGLMDELDLYRKEGRWRNAYEKSKKKKSPRPTHR